MGKSFAYSPDNLPPRRPVICARKHNVSARNTVDHVAFEMGNGEAAYNTGTHRSMMEVEKSTVHKTGRRAVPEETYNTIDHVSRLLAGEKGRRMHEQSSYGVNTTAITAASPQQQQQRVGAGLHTLAYNSSRPTTPTRMLESAESSRCMTPFRGSNSDCGDENAATQQRRNVGGGCTPTGQRHPSFPSARALQTPSPLGATRMPNRNTALRGSAVKLIGGGAAVTDDANTQRSTVKPRLPSNLNSYALSTATNEQANVKAAAEAEALANDQAALDYYGDIGVGLGITSRKKTVAPPHEPHIHPITGQLLPSARAASANRIFDKSGIDVSLRLSIAEGNFNVPLARKRSSIAVSRVGQGLDGQPPAVLSRHSSFRFDEPDGGVGEGGPFNGNTTAASRPANNPSACMISNNPAVVRFISPKRYGGGGRYALRAAHPSESSHTDYLFGSKAQAARDDVPPRKIPHPLDDTTFDKDPTPQQLAKERRYAYAIEMVQPRAIPTNVSTFEMRDTIPTHEELLKELVERPATRRGALSQQYNNTDGFFDPAKPLPARAQSPARNGGAPFLHTAQRAAASGGYRRASSVPGNAGDGEAYALPSGGVSEAGGDGGGAAAFSRASSMNPNHMTVLEKRASEYHGNVPPFNVGTRRSSSPLVKVDTSRVLCPDRQPTVAEYRPRVAPSPQRQRCQAAAVMDELTTPNRARSVDTPRPQGLRSTFAVFVAPQMPLRPCTPNPTQQSQLWGTLGGTPKSYGGPTARAASVVATPRAESPRGKRRVDSPCRSSSLVLC